VPPYLKIGHIIRLHGRLEILVILLHNASEWWSVGSGNFSVWVSLDDTQNLLIKETTHVVEYLARYTDVSTCLMGFAIEINCIYCDVVFSICYIQKEEKEDPE
jgi:hypothetical protein